MVHRLIVLAIAGAVIAGSSSVARSSTLVPPGLEATVALPAAQSEAARVAFTITVPAKSQNVPNEPLSKISALTRSAKLTVFAADRTAAAAPVTVNCATACTGSISAPMGRERFVAKLFSAKDGTGRLLAMGIATQTITAQTNTIRFTLNPVVASVRLRLKTNVISAGSPGATTQLLITALDSSGAVIVGPGSYVDRYGRPLIISIANSSPLNTSITPSTFAKPFPSQGASDVATITYRGRAHFHYPVFRVANLQLPSEPRGGVVLTYAPGSGDPFFKPEQCLGFGLIYSVGGYRDGGPYYALATPAIDRTNQGCLLPATADIWRMSSPGVTYDVNPNHDGVVLGFGSDKNVYFAYNSSGSNSATRFGYLGRLAVRVSANISALSALRLGNDGSLWFSGVWNGRATIGKLAPAGLGTLRPQLFSVPNAQAVLSIEPGIGNTEALLYSAVDGIYLATIGTDLSGFKTVRLLTNPANPGVGDLLAGRDGNFYVSAFLGQTSNVYKITAAGAITPFCRNVQQVVRLADGTGVEFGVLANGNLAVVHVLPGVGCIAVPVFPTQSGAENPILENVDSTTDDWIFYYNPSGHRTGVW